MNSRNGAKLRVWLVLGALAVVPMARGQQVAATGMGVVTGHVVCGDTQRPARFATVTLLGVPADAAPVAKIDENSDEKAMEAAMKSAMEMMNKMQLVTAETGIDGSFTALDVPPGDYYVFGALAGYLQPKNIAQAAVDAGADVKKPLPGVLVVHVTADRETVAEVSIDRGAAVSGTVLWDDGTPAPGAMVTVVSKVAAKPLPPQFSMLAMSGGIGALLAVSDDQGHYRISGLAPGDYVAQATLQTQSALSFTGHGMNLSKMMAQKPLVIYAPSAFHKADAEVLTLKAGEDHRDEALTVNLSKVHTVSGQVLSAEDHHGLNSGIVKLTDSKDKDFVRAASLDAQGHFSVTYVPPGTYDMTITDGADTEPTKKKPGEKGGGMFSASDTTLKSYADGKQSVIVADGDVAGQDVELAPLKTVKKDDDGIGAVMGGLLGASSSQ